MLRTCASTVRSLSTSRSATARSLRPSATSRSTSSSRAVSSSTGATLPQAGFNAITGAMDFRILGPLEVVDGAAALPLGGSKQRALLALLVLHANETLSAARLIDELWGEWPPVTATKALRVHVSRLRKTLTDPVLVTRGSGYELSVAPERIDACRFEALLREARAAQPARAAPLLEQALALWRGEPLADIAH